jgi:hypothetical protein
MFAFRVHRLGARRWVGALAIATLLVGGHHVAAEPESRDKSGDTIFRPTPSANLRDMSTDRPDKTESPHTVDAGHIQVETDLVTFTHDRDDGIETDSFDLLPFNLKLGITHASDLQIVYGSFTHVRTRSTGQPAQTDAGMGDLVLRYKHNLWGNDGGRTALAVMPFIKIPTNTLATANDDVEGGLIVPLAFDLGGGVGLGLMTEIDVLRRETRGGYEPTFVNSATVSFELTDALGLYTEIYCERSSEAGASTIVTFDAGVTYAVTDNLQLDAGVNIGVTDAADDLNVFAGLSRRF